MGLLDRAVQKAAEYIVTAAQKIQPVKQPLSSWLSTEAREQKHRMPSLDSMAEQQRAYALSDLVSSAVSHIANQVATTGFNVEMKVDETTEGIINHPFELLLDKPNPAESRMEFLARTASDMLLTGNSYWWLNKENEKAEPDEMWTINPSNMLAIPDEQMYIRGYKYISGDGRELFLMPQEVAHFKLYNPKTRYYGLSKIVQLAKVIVGDLGMQDHNTRLFTSKNGRQDTILAFSEPIQDPEWEEIKKEMSDTGKKRDILMLRGTGSGEMKWAVNGMSQKDMEFLAGRKFNKEEVWDWIAPGLISWLSVSSNKASSVTGKEAFMELSVFPMNVQIAEKITNDILPVYGENLVGSFDDVRVNDSALELKEIEVYSQTHTTDEVRKRFYKDEPVGDDRGDLFPTQVARPLSAIDLESDSGIIEAKLAKLWDDKKEKERKKYRKFVKARKTDDGFKFHYLDEDEQTALKADTENADGVEQLIVLIEDMRESV